MSSNPQKPTSARPDPLALAAALLLALIALAYHPAHLEPVRIKGAVAGIGVGLLCLAAALRPGGPSRVPRAMLLALLAWGSGAGRAAPVPRSICASTRRACCITVAPPSRWWS